MRPPMEPIQHCISKRGIGNLDIDAQLKSLFKTKWIQRLLSPTNAFWKDL